jgi:RimJ/RimL family protein N-acetyltransferase
MQIYDLSTFDSERLRMRLLEEGDEALYCALYTDPELMRHIAAPMTIEAAQRSFRTACKAQSPHKQRWIIQVRGEAAAVGLVALFAEDDAAEMGVMLLGEAQGLGIATEAMAAVRDRAFLHGGLQRLWIRQQTSNGAVSPMMERLGFEPLPPDPGQPLELRWAVDREQWTAQRQALAVAAPPTWG